MKEIWNWLIENWYWVAFFFVPLFIRFGQELAKQTATPKDDEFFSKLNAFWAALMSAAKEVMNNPAGIIKNKKEN
jgi:hypothetical protein